MRHARSLRGRRRRALAPRRGMSALYIALFFLLLLGFVALGVDMGRLRLATAQLQIGADAGALAGVSAMTDSSFDFEDRPDEAVARAVGTAESNVCLAPSGGIDLLDNEDVEFGTWNAADRVFTPFDLGSSGFDLRRAANAIRVSARRLASRNNPIPMSFAAAVGIFSSDRDRNAVCFYRGGRSGFGIVGIDFIRMTGNTVIDSYNGATETYPGADGPNANGHVATNGNIELVGTVDINGDAHWGANPGDGDGYDEYFDANSNVTVTGDVTPLMEDLNFPLESVPSGVVNQGDLRLNNNQSLTLTGSNDPLNPTNYWYNDFVCRGGSTLIIDGYIKLWVSGNLDIAGHVQNNVPGNASQFQISLVNPNTTVDIRGTSDISCHLYAPGSEVKISGTPGFYGSVIGKSLTILGTSNIHYDESQTVTDTPYESALVK